MKAAGPPFAPQKFDTNRYGQKVDNFIVIFDASASMSDDVTQKGLWQSIELLFQGDKPDDSKLTAAKTFVLHMNQTLPAMKMKAGLRTFGQNEKISPKDTVLVYGMTDYTAAGLDGGVKVIKGIGGNTPMAESIRAAAEDIKPLGGKTAVILISDAERLDQAPLEAAKAMKNEYGDKVCIYTVLVGSDKAGSKLMDSIAKAGACGFATSVAAVKNSRQFADFVEKVFLEPYKDSDGDGVWDHLDQCPDTPKGVKVDEKGCPIPAPMPAAGPLDSDGDGVTDDKDQCKATPKGARVDDRGCWVISDIRFDFNKADIKPVYYPDLDEVVTVMKDNPLLNILIEGHTDSIGTEEYNQRLSERRARSVKEYLVLKGIASNRMTAMGFGESRPIASNETEEGRAKNRRVQITPVYE
jgi:OOP family OmpA-OmpF porin